MKIEVLRCQSCGAPLNPATLKCDMCGSYNIIVSVSGEQYQFASKYKLDQEINLKELIVELCVDNDCNGDIPIVFKDRISFKDKGAYNYAFYDIQSNSFIPYFDLNFETNRLERVKWFLIKDKINFLNEYFAAMNLWLKENLDQEGLYSDTIEILHISAGYEVTKNKELLEEKLDELSYFGRNGTFEVTEQNIDSLKSCIRNSQQYYAFLKGNKKLELTYWNEIFSNTSEQLLISKDDAITFSMTKGKRIVYWTFMFPIVLFGLLVKLGVGLFQVGHWFTFLLGIGMFALLFGGGFFFIDQGNTSAAIIYFVLIAMMIILFLLGMLIKKFCVQKTARYISESYRKAYDAIIKQKTELDEIEKEYYETVVNLKRISNKKIIPH